MKRLHFIELVPPKTGKLSALAIMSIIRIIWTKCVSLRRYDPFDMLSRLLAITVRKAI